MCSSCFFRSGYYIAYTQQTYIYFVQKLLTVLCAIFVARRKRQLIIVCSSVTYHKPFGQGWKHILQTAVLTFHTWMYQRSWYYLELVLSGLFDYLADHKSIVIIFVPGVSRFQTQSKSRGRYIRFSTSGIVHNALGHLMENMLQVGVPTTVDPLISATFAVTVLCFLHLCTQTSNSYNYQFIHF